MDLACNDRVFFSSAAVCFTLLCHMLLFSPIEILIKMLFKTNYILSRGFLTTLHLEVSGRPSASPSGTTLYLLAKHRWKREKSFY